MNPERNEKAMNKYSDVFNEKTIAAYQAENPFVKLNDVVYACLEKAIVSLAICPGERLNIAELAKALDVSATPIKTAIQRLIATGLVEERDNNAGYYVFDMDDRSLQNIFDTRRCLEGFSAQLCAQRLGLIDLEQMKRLAKEYRELWNRYADGDNSQENIVARRKVDVNFHQLIVESTGNDMLINCYQQMTLHANYALLRTFEFWEREIEMDNRRRLAEQHLTIVRAIATGIPDLARKAAEDHVQFASQRCILNRKIGR